MFNTIKNIKILLGIIKWLVLTILRMSCMVAVVYSLYVDVVVMSARYAQYKHKYNISTSND
jgi:hypothetical protein